METELRQSRPDVSEAAIARAVRSPRGVIAALVRIVAMELYEAHLHLRWWGDQYFPDTAELEALSRHASIWGIVRRPATRAVGAAEVAGVNGTSIPIGTRLVGATAVYVTTAAATISGGTASLAVSAIDAGAAGNMAGNLPLSLETPIAGIPSPVALVDAAGLAGGADVETPASLLKRLLKRIQEPAHGGSASDYPVWVQNSFAALDVLALPNWVGLGTVGVAVVMGTADAPVAPNETEIDAIAAMLEIERPVTAEVVVIAAELQTVNITVTIDPYSAAVRTAITAAIRSFFATEAGIGRTLYRSRLSEAISAASGEYRHTLTVPAGDVIVAANKYPVLGAITFVAPS